jgi:hypothetical protein
MSGKEMDRAERGPKETGSRLTTTTTTRRDTKYKVRMNLKEAIGRQNADPSSLAAATDHSGTQKLINKIRRV